MKTKNLFIACALFLLGLANANSAMAQSNTDNVTLNLKFKPVQTITVDPDQKTVDFVYQTETDYTSGVTLAAKTKHLKVFSSGGFEVKVKAKDENFTSDNNTALTIPVNHVSVTASKSEDNPRTYQTIDVAVALSTTDQLLIRSNGGGKGLEFDVLYDATKDATEAYIDGYIDGYNDSHKDVNGFTVYTTTVYYTISPK